MKYFLKEIGSSGPKKSRFPKLRQKAQVLQAPINPLFKKEWYPPDVKTEEERNFYEAVKLKPAPGGSTDLVNPGNPLVIKHWEHVKEYLKTHPLKGKSKAEAKAWLQKAIWTPEQEVVLWSEASLRNPLSHEGYEKYMIAFEKVVGSEQFKRLLGGDAKAVVDRAKKQEKELMKRFGHDVK